jgi:hypothetical protein
MNNNLGFIPLIVLGFVISVFYSSESFYVTLFTKFNSCSVMLVCEPIDLLSLYLILLNWIFIDVYRSVALGIDSSLYDRSTDPRYVIFQPLKFVEC